MSGSVSRRVALLTANARNLLALTYSIRLGYRDKHHLHLAANQIRHCRRATAIGYVHQIDAWQRGSACCEMQKSSSAAE